MIQLGRVVALPQMWQELSLKLLWQPNLSRQPSTSMGNCGGPQPLAWRDVAEIQTPPQYAFYVFFETYQAGELPII